MSELKEAAQSGDLNHSPSNSQAEKLPITGSLETKKGGVQPTSEAAKKPKKSILPSSLSTHPEIPIAMLLENLDVIGRIEGIATHITGSTIVGNVSMISIHIIVREPHTIDCDEQSIIFDGKEI